MDSFPQKNYVLSQDAIARKIRRMALQVAESHTGAPELILAGITGNGEVVARALMEELRQLGPWSLTLIRVELNKRAPSEVTLQPAIDAGGKVIILVDDVANTGRTMLYALKPFLQFHPQKIQTVVLVERSHKLFPVQTDVAGLSLATTLEEHIFVEVEGDTLTRAYLV